VANEFVRVEFVPAKRGELATVTPRVSVKAADGAWVDAGADASAEAYVAVFVRKEIASRTAVSSPLGGGKGGGGV
jgi:hypothetical protein